MTTTRPRNTDKLRDAAIREVMKDRASRTAVNTFNPNPISDTAQSESLEARYYLAQIGNLAWIHPKATLVPASMDADELHSWSTSTIPSANASGLLEYIGAEEAPGATEHDAEQHQILIDPLEKARKVRLRLNDRGPAQPVVLLDPTDYEDLPD